MIFNNNIWHPQVDPSQASTSHETKPEIFEHCQTNMSKFNEANKLYSKDLFNEITRCTGELCVICIVTIAGK